MDYKISNLKEKIYKDFIRGVYGPPKIPSPSEVAAKVAEITSPDYTPITDNQSMKDIDIGEMSKKFGSIIDDIGILFESVEDESRDVLDQLTNSLKEHNGVKRELKRIKATSEDIINGKLGEAYLQYNFTESFDDIQNINSIRSDPIDTDAGLFTIRDNGSKVVNMQHYINRKLVFNVIDNLSSIEEQEFVGDANAENIFSKNNPRSITYRIKTLRPTPLKIVTTFQLRPDGNPVSINAVALAIDSNVSKGFVRLYYRDGYVWKNVKGVGLQEIKGDQVYFGFKAIEASSIKLEFIKDGPDVSTTTEYFVTLHEIAIARSSTKSVAALYSKPIVLKAYASEAPVLNNIACIVDSDIPSDCKLRVYVAEDIRMSGRFVNGDGNAVYADSIDISDFDPILTGFVYLSDILERQTLSGLIPYRGLDFNWKEIKSAQALGETVPEVLEFKFTSNEATIVNSLYSTAGDIKYGDRYYTGPWPESAAYTDEYVSGWCNADNPAWETVLKGMVASGLLNSGIDLSYLVGGWSGIADYGDGHTTYESGINPLILDSSYWSGQWLGYGSGYPYNYFDDEFGRVLRYGDTRNSLHGWWRPYASWVTPTGIKEQYIVSGYMDHSYAIDYGEFYFNGITFYKIFKFDASQTVLESSIKLYQFEERPISSDNDEYNHMFRWNYKSALIDEVNTLVGKVDPNNVDSPNFSGYTIVFPSLSDNEEYSDFNILEVRQHNSNFVLQDPDDFVTYFYKDAPGISGISLTPLSENYRSMKPAGMSFDIKYNYKIKNRYLSHWTSYAIVSPAVNGDVEITNKNVYGKVDTRIIKNIVVENLDNGSIQTIDDADGRFVIPFNTVGRDTNTHFKVTMYCDADEDSGFCAKEAGSNQYFIPREETGNMTVPGGIKFVSKLESMRICDLGTLLYDTPIANDRKCALITDYNNDTFLVIKKPFRDGFPGYVFNSIDRSYSVENKGQLRNKGHYVRRGFDASENEIIYTTGSSGSVVYDTLENVDSTWNDGGVFQLYQNTSSSDFYPLHTTYGHRVNLEDTDEIIVSGLLLTDGDCDPRAPSVATSRVGSTEWAAWLNTNYNSDYSNYTSSSDNSYTIGSYTVPNRGFLFYNTAENLPTYYSISYDSMREYDELAKRFLYKIELESDGSKQIAPKVRSIRFEINRGK